jgi:hypothetical protein
MMEIVNKEEGKWARPASKAFSGGRPAGPKLLLLLRRRVLCLPEEQRIVVALRFGAELTPEEIARALDQQEGTILSILEQALGELRREVVASGFQARVWAGLPATLRIAILTGEPVPRGLRGRILKRIEGYERRQCGSQEAEQRAGAQTLNASESDAPGDRTRIALSKRLMRALHRIVRRRIRKPVSVD